MGYAIGGGAGTGSWMTTVVRRLIWINIGIFLAQMVTRSVLPWGALGLAPDMVVRQGFLWQMITYMYLHGDLFHVLFNLVNLYVFGPDVERLMGSRKFFIYYTLCGIGGALTACAAYLQSPEIRIVGASGAIYGVMFAYAAFYPYRPLLVYFVAPIEARWLVLALGVISVIGGIQGGDGIAHLCHLGGLATGMAIFIASGRFRISFGRIRTAPARPSVIHKMITSVREKYDSRKEEQRRMSADEIDAILDKIAREGMRGLTRKERDRLKSASRSMKDEKN